MKRRSFLNVLLGLPAAAAIPLALPEAEKEEKLPRGAGYYYKLGIENAGGVPKRSEEFEAHADNFPQGFENPQSVSRNSRWPTEHPLVKGRKRRG